jgi:flagellar hook-length control protein FliK
VACALPAMHATDAGASLTAPVPTVPTPDSAALDPSLSPTTDAASPATARGPGSAAVLPGPAEADPASAAAAARSGPARRGPESETAAVAGADGLEASAATSPAADAAGTEHAQPDGASPVPNPATPSASAQPGAAAIPIPAATVAATAASASAAAPQAAPGRTDAARRTPAATARATTEPARGADSESRRTAGRADAADAAGTRAAAPSALPAQPNATTEPRAARQATADAGRSGHRDHAIERAGTEGNAALPSSAASAAPSASALLPRFADHLQAALPAAPVAGTHPAEGSTGTATAHAQLPAALQSPEFPPALGAQISLFARNGVERATIEINPLRSDRARWQRRAGRLPGRCRRHPPGDRSGSAHAGQLAARGRPDIDRRRRLPAAAVLRRLCRAGVGPAGARPGAGWQAGCPGR